jgi:hypothetical protein
MRDREQIKILIINDDCMRLEESVSKTMRFVRLIHNQLLSSKPLHLTFHFFNYINVSG